MALRNRAGSLTAEEKRIVKALLAARWRNQDIQALVNIGREATINSARVTGVKQDDSIQAAGAEEVAFYKKRKESYDWNTGLNLYDDERIIRSREAMILAVQVFNSPICLFKTEVFSVLTNIAWTYLLHEFYIRKGNRIVGADGRSLALSQMLERQDCPLSRGMKNNLRAMKIIRDDVEHALLRRSDLKWSPLFQACCLNFDTAISKIFGEKLSLKKELSFALQFAKLDIEQINSFQNFDIPENINALDARLRQGLSEADIADLEYQLQVIYTLDNASKSKAAIKFIKPDSEEAKDVKNVLLKYKIADEEYPFKPTAVVRTVSNRTQKKFLLSNHTQAWHLYKVRPKKGSNRPTETNKDFCIYHQAHDDYTYSEKWISYLCEKVESEAEFKKIKSTKL